MQIRTKQIFIVILFSLMSVFVYVYGINIDYGTLNVTANVSNFNYSVGRSDFECSTSRCSHAFKPGSYIVTVTKDGFLPSEKDVKLTQLESLDLQIDLEPVPIVKEIDSQNFQPLIEPKGGFLVNQSEESNQNILAIDSSRNLTDFSFLETDSTAILIYDNKDIYHYKLNENLSVKIKVPLDFEPNQVQNLSTTEMLISNTSNQVFKGVINNLDLQLIPVKKISSVKHYLPLKQGYLAILPIDSDSGFNISDILVSSKEEGNGSVSNQNIEAQFEKVGRGLFYYSNQSDSLTQILDIGSFEPNELELIFGTSNESQNAFLKSSKSIYKIEL